MDSDAIWFFLCRNWGRQHRAWAATGNLLLLYCAGAGLSGGMGSGRVGSNKQRGGAFSYIALHDNWFCRSRFIGLFYQYWPCSLGAYRLLYRTDPCCNGPGMHQYVRFFFDWLLAVCRKAPESKNKRFGTFYAVPLVWTPVGDPDTVRHSLGNLRPGPAADYV